MVTYSYVTTFTIKEFLSALCIIKKYYYLHEAYLATLKK